MKIRKIIIKRGNILRNSINNRNKIKKKTMMVQYLDLIQTCHYLVIQVRSARRIAEKRKKLNLKKIPKKDNPKKEKMNMLTQKKQKKQANHTRSLS